MRPGFIIAVLGLGALVVFALIRISPRSGTTSLALPGAPAAGVGDGAQARATQAPKEAGIGGPIEAPSARPLAMARTKEKASQAEDTADDDRDEQHEARVAARIAELENLSAKTDHASLETLLSEVKNPHPEIRQGALDAISQSGNRAALPGLREALAQTEDSREKEAIEEVIEFLSLPTLTELLRGHGATNNRPARGKR